MQIDFTEKGFDFNISYGMLGACLAIEGTILSYKFDVLNCIVNHNFPTFANPGELAQLVERLHGMQEVSGSNPLFSTYNQP